MTFEPFTFEQHARWVKEHVQCVFCEDTRGIIAIRDDAIVGAMIADSWSVNSAQAHYAVLDPLCFKHGMHVKFLDYVFNTAGRSQLIGLTPSNNEKAIKINRHFGFTQIARLPDAFSDGVDYLVMRLLKSECKYLTPMREAA